MGQNDPSQKDCQQDTCQSCDNFEERNQFLEENCSTSVDWDKSEGCFIGQGFKAYQQDHEKYKILFDAAPDAIFVLDTETGIILEANTKAAELLGIPLDQIIGIHHSKMHPPEEAEKHMELFRESVRKKSTRIVEDIYVRNSAGKNIPVRASGNVIQLNTQEIVIGICRDMTEQKEAEQEIVSLSKFPEENPNPVLRYSKDGTLVYTNQPGKELLLEYCGDTYQTLPTAWAKDLKESLLTEIPKQTQETCGGKTFLLSYAPVSRAEHVTVYILDITEKQKVQQQLEESEKRFKELYSNAAACLSRIRISDGKAIACSRATVSLFGYTDAEQFMEQFSTQTMYVNPQRKEQLMAALQQDKRVEGFQAQVKRKDGTPFWISITAEIFPEKDYIEEVMVDITASKTLSKAEKKVLDMLMEGMSNKQIARALERSVRTIEDHRSHIMQKMDADSLVELTQKALNLPDYDQ